MLKSRPFHAPRQKGKHLRERKCLIYSVVPVGHDPTTP